MPIASLVVGRVYFQATYEDPRLSRPIILSFEYLGKDIYGEPSTPEDSHQYFNFLPPFRAVDENNQEIEENVLHMFTEEGAGALHDLDGLLAELASRREAWSRSGRQLP
jgi:hypothetical protein